MNSKPVTHRGSRAQAHKGETQVRWHVKEFSNILASGKIPVENNAVSLPGTDLSADTWPVQGPGYLSSLRWLPATSIFSAEYHEKPYLAWQGLLSSKELAFVKGLPHFLLSQSLAMWKNSSYMDFRFAELVKSWGWVHRWWGVSGYKYSSRKTTRQGFCVSGL